MIRCTKYAVRLPSGGWSGASRYSYRTGRSGVGDTGFQYAKLFTRRCDATARAKQERGEVVAVTVTLNEPATEGKCPDQAGCTRYHGSCWCRG